MAGEGGRQNLFGLNLTIHNIEVIAEIFNYGKLYKLAFVETAGSNRPNVPGRNIMSSPSWAC